MPDVAPGFRFVVAGTVVRIFQSQRELHISTVLTLLSTNLKVESNGVTGRKVGLVIPFPTVFHFVAIFDQARGRGQRARLTGVDVAITRIPRWHDRNLYGIVVLD